MKDFPGPLALGEFLLHNFGNQEDKREVIIVLIASDFAVNSLLLHYLCKAFARVYCKVILDDKQITPNLELLKDAGNPNCQLEVSFSYISNKNSFDYASEVRKCLPSVADIIIYVNEESELQPTLSLSISSRNLMERLENGADELLGPDGVLILARVQKRIKQEGDMTLSNAALKHKDAIVLGSWIETSDTPGTVEALNKEGKYQKVFGYYTRLMHRSNKLRKEDSKASNLILASASVSVLSAAKENISFGFRWNSKNYVSEDMRRRLSDPQWWPDGVFYNQGLQNWRTIRKNWLEVENPFESDDDEERPVIKYMELIEGLLTNPRYKLPTKMPLGELIEVYVDIWDSQ